MARNILYIGNRNPSVSATLLDGTGAAINLTGCTVQFALRREYAAGNTFKNSATVVVAAAGTVRYDFGTNDLLNAVPGIYWGRWLVTDASGRVEDVDAGGFELKKAA